MASNQTSCIGHAASLAIRSPPALSPSLSLSSATRTRSNCTSPIAAITKHRHRSTRHPQQLQHDVVSWTSSSSVRHQYASPMSPHLCLSFSQHVMVASRGSLQSSATQQIHNFKHLCPPTGMCIFVINPRACAEGTCKKKTPLEKDYSYFLFFFSYSIFS